MACPNDVKRAEKLGDRYQHKHNKRQEDVVLRCTRRATVEAAEGAQEGKDKSDSSDSAA